MGLGTEGPLGDCLCTNWAAWGEGRTGGWVAEGVRGTHVSMGLTAARIDACMDHLKGVQGPRKRQGFQNACTASLCPSVPLGEALCKQNTEPPVT